jgi:hypothetical protein
MSKIKILICAIATVLAFESYAAAKKKCMFIGATPGRENAEWDAYIMPQLKEWGYEIDKKHNSTDLKSYTDKDYEPYDFIFLSETVHSTLHSPLKLAPKPMLNSDGWGGKKSALDFGPEKSVGIYEPGKPIVFLPEAKDKPLAAGYAPGTVVELGKMTTKKECLIVWGKPTIPIIPIATVENKPEEMVVYGIEKGTKNTSGETIKNRIATVGAHAWCYNHLNESGIKLLKAGIKWVLEEEKTAIEAEMADVSANISLSANFGNSIHSITYFVPQQSQTGLTVWNKMGQKVRTLVNSVKTAGQHTVGLDASNLPGGMYIINLQAVSARHTKIVPLTK